MSFIFCHAWPISLAKLKEKWHKTQQTVVFFVNNLIIYLLKKAFPIAVRRRNHIAIILSLPHGVEMISGRQITKATAAESPFNFVPLPTCLTK